MPRRRKKPTILVVDDEAAIREVLKVRLGRWGYRVLLAESGSRAAERAAADSPDLVISDVVLPDLSGLELLASLKAGDPDRPVVLITAFGTIDTAVEAMKRGALDFLTKPLDYDKLAAVLDAARRQLERRRSTRRLEERLDGEPGLGHLVGLAPPMRELYDSLRLLAASDASAIFTGESGTGKDLAARTLHELSSRSQGPFVAVNTAAIAEGLTESELFGHERGAFTGAVGARPGYFELADGGILFLDEIAEMRPELQPKLLRVLEDGRVRKLGGKREIAVDVRVLAATNHDPERAIRDGRLREDLYYRLAVFSLELPPLRRRRSDIPLLAQHFVRLANDKHGVEVAGVDPDALALLRRYPWPGNVRELRNVVERGVIVARGGWLEPPHLPPYLEGGKRAGRRGLMLPPEVTAAEAERLLILDTLERTGNNKTQAARTLGLDVKTIRNKLKAYGLEARRD